MISPENQAIEKTEKIGNIIRRIYSIYVIRAKAYKFR